MQIYIKVKVTFICQQILNLFCAFQSCQGGEEGPEGYEGARRRRPLQEQGTQGPEGRQAHAKGRSQGRRKAINIVSEEICIIVFTVFLQYVYKK